MGLGRGQVQGGGSYGWPPQQRAKDIRPGASD